MSGLFITFEGVECSGKSLQSRLLLEYCLKHNIPSLLVREPGSTKVGEDLRSILLNQYCTPLTEFFILSASRTQLTETIIKPNLDQNLIVISDRYFHSSLIYQGYGRNLNSDELKYISQIATQNLHPNITFLLNPSFDEAQKRLQTKHSKGDLDRIELENSEFHKKIYQSYNNLYKEYPYICSIDGNQQPMIIHQEILQKLSQTDSRFN